jgi:protoheme ferro-lyase
VRTIARIVVICVSFPADRSESLFEQVLEFLLLRSAEALQALAERVR